MAEIHDKTPLVSVLIAAYNREKYVATAIESVLASTYQNFELIIVDDCSKDETADIAKWYASKDLRVKVFINDQNLGDYSNRNKAASYAMGKYLKYVDADDYIYPWGLELLIQMMEKFPNSGWGLCSLEQNEKEYFPIELSPREAYEYNYIGPGLFHKAPLSSIIKRESFEQLGGFSSLRMVGDFEMWHRLALKFSVVLMPHGIVWYREHGDQEIKDIKKFLFGYEKIIIDYFNNPECPLEKSMRSKILKQRKVNLIKNMIKSAIRFKYKNFIQYWKCFQCYYA